MSNNHITPYPRIFVPHVKKNYEDRELHIDDMMSRMGLEFEYMLDGDISDIEQDSDMLSRYFDNRMLVPSAAVSCAVKHLLIYEKMVEQNIASALILEDDIFLSENFVEIFGHSMTQSREFDFPFYIVYEATHLKFVPRSQRRHGVVIYPIEGVQCTGAYYINLATAAAILNQLKLEKCSLPIDIYLEKLNREGHFKTYWCHPAIAQQGSHNGMMTSSISPPRKESLSVTRIKRYLTTKYKSVLYYFR